MTSHARVVILPHSAQDSARCVKDPGACCAKGPRTKVPILKRGNGHGLLLDRLPLLGIWGLEPRDPADDDFTQLIGSVKSEAAAVYDTDANMRVSLFVTCLVDQLYPQVGIAAVKLLRGLGLDVVFEQDQTCCGQPALNTGYVDEARKVAACFLKTFRRAELIVTPSGSCATMVKKFIPELFEPGSPQHQEAEQIAGRTFELSDYLVNQLGVTDVEATFPHTVTFHDSCHQLRELGIFEQPRTLIRRVRDLQFVEMENSTRCCGFGGTFGVKFEALSAAIGSDKVAAIEASGADVVVSNDVSCLMHIEGLLKRRRIPVRAMHLAELLVQTS